MTFIVRLILFFILLTPNIFVSASAPMQDSCNFSGTVKNIAQTNAWAEISLRVTQSSCTSLQEKNISVRVDYLTEHGLQFYSKEELAKMSIVANSVIKGNILVYEPIEATIQKTTFYDMDSIEVINKGSLSTDKQNVELPKEFLGLNVIENIILFSLLVIVSVFGILFVMKRNHH